jgi:hypothetical protein
MHGIELLRVPVCSERLRHLMIYSYAALRRCHGRLPGARFPELERRRHPKVVV